MIGSNNYMGLTHDPRILEAAKAALDQVRQRQHRQPVPQRQPRPARPARGGPGRLGRQAEGPRVQHGYQTNLGTIGALVGRNDTVFLDKLDHACIQDGARLGWGEIKRFRHAELDHLEQQLAGAPTRSAAS